MKIENDVRNLAQRIVDRTMRGIAVEMAALIRSGVVPVGSKLPAVRDFAEALGVSPATVSGAWKQLRSHRMVTGDRRSGVWVQGDQTSLRPLRFEGRGDFGGNLLADLRFAVPDPDLLPDLARALAVGAKVPDLNSYRRVPITSGLREAASATWPYEASAFIATNGGYDALYLALNACAVPGAYVAVEDPSTVRILDILDKLGARAIAVSCDENGPLPEALAAALQRKPIAFVFESGTHAVTGVRVSRQRLNELAELLKETETIVVEDDGLGDLAEGRSESLGGTFPERTIHIRSYSKSLGPDLRVAVMSGPDKLVDQIQSYRNFREGWTSRVLQSAVAWMLGDKSTMAQVATARQIYRERRALLSNALSERGIPERSGSGLSIWLPVPSEQNALVTLAARGIAVTPGGPTQIVQRPHIRIATSRLTDNVDEVADGIFAAIRGPKSIDRSLGVY